MGIMQIFVWTTNGYVTLYVQKMCHISGFKFNFFDSLLKLASSIIFYLLNLSANLLFHTYKHC